MARSRFAAGATALALIGASVFGGALAAAAYTPTAPTLSWPIVGDGTPSVTTVSDGPSFEGVMQHVDGGSETTIVYRSDTEGISWTEYCYAPKEYFDAADPASPWSCAAETILAPGTHYFRAATVDNNTGDTSAFSATVSYTIGGTQAASILSPAPGAVTTDATPVFEGYGPQLGTVSVVRDGTEVLCSAEATLPDGYWQCESSVLLARANPEAWSTVYSVSAVGTDVLGQPVVGSEPQTVEIAIPGGPTLYQEANPWYTTDPLQAFTGELPSDVSSFTIWRWVDTEGGGATATPLCTMPVDSAGGVYTCDPRVNSSWGATLEPGVNEILGSVGNEAGEAGFYGAPIFITLVAQPVVTSPGPETLVYTKENQPLFSGTADPLGSTVTIESLDDTLCVSEVTEGTWECTPALDLPDGTYPYVARLALPGEGGESVTSIEHTVVIDTVALPPVVTTSGTLEAPYPTFAGTGEPGAEVTLYLDDAPVTCQDAAIVGDDSTWSCTPATPIAPGVYDVTTTQRDRALNVSTLPSAPQAIVTVANPPGPPAPTIVSPTSGDIYWNQLGVFGEIEANAGSPVRIDVTAVGALGSTTCFDVVEPVSEGPTYWGCYLELVPDTYSISAVASLEGVPGTESPSSTPVSVAYVGGLPKPSVTYTLGPASVAFDAEGVPTGDLQVGWFEVTPGGGEGEGGEGEGGPGFVLLDDCGTGGEGEGEGGGEGEGALLTSAPAFAAAEAQCGPYSDLKPGVYNAYVTQYAGGESFSSTDDYIAIPPAPTLGASTNSGTTATFSGTGAVTGYTVAVERADGASICSGTVTESGEWSCTATLAAGTASYRAVQQATGFEFEIGEWIVDASIAGYSDYSDPVSVTAVVPTPPVDPTPEPTAPPVPSPPPTSTPTPSPTPTPTVTAPPPAAASMFSFTLSTTRFAPGETTTLTGEGAPPLAQIDAELHSTPVHLGSTTAGDDGTFSLTVTVPLDVEPGEHEIVLIVTPAGGEPMQLAKGVTITDPPRAQGQVDPSALTSDAESNSAAVADRNDPAAPSALTASLKTVATVFDNPILLGGAALAGLALLLLVALPAELLNSTISENYGRITRGIPTRRVVWWDRFRAWLKVTPVLGGVLITFLTAFIFGFVDPRFGFDLTSLRTVLAVGLALLVVGYIASALSGAIIRRTLGLATVVELKPLGIVLAIVGVVLSRLLDFAPGFLIGLVLGLSVIGMTSAAQRAKAALIHASVVFGLAVLAWIGYSILTAGGPPDSFVNALAVDTLVAVTAEGLTALFVGMLPFRLLNGANVFEFSKPLWLVSYIVAAAAFVLIVIPSSWGELNGPVTNWLIVLGSFAIVALAIYFYFRLTDKDDDGDDASTTERADAEAIEL